MTTSRTTRAERARISSATCIMTSRSGLTGTVRTRTSSCTQSTRTSGPTHTLLQEVAVTVPAARRAEARPRVALLQAQQQQAQQLYHPTTTTTMTAAKFLPKASCKRK